jgi:hypothetical protein
MKLPCCGRDEGTVREAEVRIAGKLYRCLCRCGAVVDITVDGQMTLVSSPHRAGGGRASLTSLIQSPVLS